MIAMWPDSHSGNSTGISFVSGSAHISVDVSENPLTPCGISQKRSSLPITCSLPFSPASSRMSVPGASVVEQYMYPTAPFGYSSRAEATSSTSILCPTVLVMAVTRLGRPPSQVNRSIE